MKIIPNKQSLPIGTLLLYDSCAGTFLYIICGSIERIKKYKIRVLAQKGYISSLDYKEASWDLKDAGILFHSKVLSLPPR